jgi:CubicO group peptidase (beta-lactamase class C family)
MSASRPGLDRRAFIAAASLLAAPTWARREPLGPAPATLSWPPAPPSLAARQRQAFAGLAGRLGAGLHDVQSVVVLQRDHLAFEFQRPGVAPGGLHDVQSVTKSVLSLLFGQAMADGLVRGPDELVALRLPAMLRLGADARVRQLRFVHLLTMTAGWPGELTARRDRDDNLRWIVQRPFQADPGARFTYDNGAANLLALALANAAGQPLARYARERLFQPLGIRDFDWRQGAQGHALGAHGLSLSTRAMARLGELVLHEGQWQGRALVPRDYLRAATSRQNAGGAPLGNAYGYLWWIGAPARRGAPPAVMANGYGGQWIHVDPALQLVVALTARRTPESAARGQGLALIQRHILPAARRIAQ